jgi:hypothetical protein
MNTTRILKKHGINPHPFKSLGFAAFCNFQELPGKVLTVIQSIWLFQSWVINATIESTDHQSRPNRYPVLKPSTVRHRIASPQKTIWRQLIEAMLYDGLNICSVSEHSVPDKFNSCNIVIYKHNPLTNRQHVPDRLALPYQTLFGANKLDGDTVLFVGI